MSPETVKSILNNIISELHQDPSLFVARPGIDFTRDRKLPLDTMLKIIIGMNGGSIKRELYDYDKSISVTSAAFVQQRDKILPDMFGYIFRQFTDQLPLDKTYRGYITCWQSMVPVYRLPPTNVRTHTLKTVH